MCCVNARAMGYKAGTLESIEQFVQMIKSFSSMLNTKNAYEVATHVGKQTNIVKELFNDKTTEGLARYENIQELLNSIKEWVDDQQNRSIIDEDGILIDNAETQETQKGQAGLSGYLQQITLLTDTDQKDPEADTVKLMTIHAAKGLEFSCVFAAGLEESLFPNAMSINTREELEEERRLFYVVITRAKHKLWITYANSRYRFGSVIQNDPSRFIEEIPEDQLDRSYAGGGVRNQIGSWAARPAYDRLNRGYGGTDESSTKSRESAKPTYISSSAKTPAPIHIPSVDFRRVIPVIFRQAIKWNIRNSASVKL